MSFKASNQMHRILILQIVIASILEFGFTAYTPYCIVFVIDSLLSYWYGDKSFL